MSIVDELKELQRMGGSQPTMQSIDQFHRKATVFLRDHGQALVELVAQNEALWELVCWNIDNFRDLPLTDGYYAKWLEKAEALLARTKASAGETE